MEKRTYRADALKAYLTALKDADSRIEFEINKLKTEQQAIKIDISDTESKLGNITSPPHSLSSDILNQQELSKEPITTPEDGLSYSTHMTWDEKVLFVLNQNKSIALTSPAIYEMLSAIDDNLRTDDKGIRRKNMKRVTGALYNLVGDKKIIKENNSENQNIYHVK